MEWPDTVPYFTEDDVHNLPRGEYEIWEDGQVKRCAMGWLKHLFLDLEEYGPLNYVKLHKAEAVFRRHGKVSRYDSVEEWNDQQTREKIADVLNKTMAELGYEV